VCLLSALGERIRSFTFGLDKRVVSVVSIWLLKCVVNLVTVLADSGIYESCNGRCKCYFFCLNL